MGQDIASVNSEQQAIFFSVLLETGKVPVACKAAGYANASYGYKLAKKMRKDLIDHVEMELSINGPRAAKVLTDALSKDSDISAAQMLASNQVLDRIGVVKKAQLEVTGKVEHNVMVFLPEKDKVEIIDIEADE